MAAPNIDELRPMEAPEGTVKAFTDPAWIYEIKFDGYRTLAGFGAGAATQLRTERGADCTRWYPEVVELLATLPGGPHVINGRNVMGLPLVERKALLKRLLAKVPKQVLLYVGDFSARFVRRGGDGTQARRLRGEAQGEHLSAWSTVAGLAQDQAA